MSRGAELVIQILMLSISEAALMFWVNSMGINVGDIRWLGIALLFLNYSVYNHYELKNKR